MIHSFNRSLWDRWADFTTRYPRLILGVIIVVTVFFSIPLFHLKIGTDLSDFRSRESQQLIDSLENKFQRGTFHIIIFESQSEKSLLNPDLLHEQLNIIHEIKSATNVKTDSLAEGIDEGLKRVKGKSLLDYDEYTPIAEALLALSGPKTVRDLEKVTRNYTSDPEALHLYAKLRAAFSAAPAIGGGDDRMKFSIPFVKATCVRVELPPELSVRQQQELAVKIRNLTDSLNPPGLNIYHISEQLGARDVDIHARKNALLMGLILMTINCVLLWSLFRSMREIVIAFVIMGVASIWTFGAAALMGFRMSSLHLIALPILLGTGNDDNFVFARRFAQENTRHKHLRTAIQKSLAATGNGIFLTTFTTFIAFLAAGLSADSVGLRSFSLLVSFSMVVAFVAVITLQGAIRMTFRSPIENAIKPSLPFWLRGFIPWSSKVLHHSARPILIFSSLLLLVSGIGWGRLDTEFDHRIFLRRTMPSYEADHVFGQYFRQKRRGFIVIEGNVANPLLLKKMRMLEENMNQLPFTGKILGRPNVTSVLDLIDKMQLRITPAMDVQKLFDRITTNEATADYVLNQSYKEAANNVIHKEGNQYDGLLMEFVIQAANSKQIQTFIQNLDQEIRSLRFDEIPGIQVRVGSSQLNFVIDQAKYFRDSFRSFLWSFLLIFLTLLCFWRNISHALLAMCPMLFSLVLTMGLMGLVGIKLNIMTISIGAVVVGLGVDYSIHLIERFTEEMRRNPGIKRVTAIERVLTNLGPTLWTSSLTTSAGFGAACVLAMPIAASFGLLVALAIMLVYLASIFILPVLSLRFLEQKL